MRKQAWVYVLKCQHDTYYVGFTRRLAHRIQDHFTGAGAIFTKLHEPKKLILTRKVKSELDEFETWLGFVALYGLKRVGGYNKFLVQKLGLKWPFDETTKAISDEKFNKIDKRKGRQSLLFNI